MAKYDKKKDVKKIKILSGVLGALLSVTIAGSVVLGVGFGKYGKDMKDWFKSGPSISQPDNPDTPDTPDTPVVPEVKKSTPLEVGETIALWDGAEGKNLYANTDVEVWKEFFAEYQNLDRKDMLFFPFFAAVGADAKRSEWATLEGNKQLVAMYYANSDGKMICLQFGNYNILIALQKDEDGNESVLFNDAFIDGNGKVLLTSYAPDAGQDISIEYVGFEGYLIDSSTGERTKDDNGNDITLREYPSLVTSSDFKMNYTSYEWFNRLFSTTPFEK